MHDIEEPFIGCKEIPRASYHYKFRQYLLAIVCMLQSLCAGSAFSFSSVLATSEISFNTTQYSWIASIPTLSILPMVLTAGWILNWIGRRFALALTIIITLISWTMLFFSQTYELMFVSRLLSGIYTGLAYPIMLVYLAEITDPKIRPQCLTSVPFGCNLGIMLTQLLGSFVHWRTLAMLVCVLPVINMAILLYIKDSYVWLLNKNRVDEAKKAFTWFRGTGHTQKSEFLSILDMEICKISSVKQKIKQCFKMSFIKPFLLTSLLFLTSELSGDGAVIFYTSNIIKTITKNADAQFYSNLVLNALRVIATFLSTILFNRFSTRSVLIFSGYSLALSLGNFSLFMYLSRVYPENTHYPVVCLVLIIANVMFFGLGVGPGPTVICGEIYPSVLREIGGALSSFVLFGTLFVIVKAMPYLFELVHHECIFLAFAFCTFTGISIIYYVLPNTKNKTLTQLDLVYAS
ncbi:facilitated trehalose transporter Tret1-like [Atheta coriaria]|uniref:facilitated trehalose transporter Tret1-like n=1 Tax=Dalotia coriaria TaxID=877792 RepID=UPI0031F3E655